MKNVNKTILSEIQEKAKKNERHYRKNDGTTRCVISNSNINYFDENEQKWKHLDNAITETEDHYETTVGSFKVRLSKDAEKSSVEVFDENTSIFWTYLGLDEPKARKSAPTVKMKNNDSSSSLVGNEACYTDVNEGVDIQYIMNTNGVKENIIITKKQKDYSFKFEYKVRGVELRTSEDGDKLEFYSTRNNKVEFTIPAPYMFDANNIKSTDVHYEVENFFNGTYIVKVVASKNWINSKDRLFPISIDPSLTQNCESIISCKTEVYKIITTDTNTSEHLISTLTDDVLKLVYNNDRKYYGIMEIDTSGIREKNNTLKATLEAHTNIPLSNIEFDCHITVDGINCDPFVVTSTEKLSLSIPISEYLKKSENNLTIKLSLRNKYFDEALVGHFFIEMEYIEETEKNHLTQSAQLVGGAEEIVDMFTGGSVTRIVDAVDENVGIEIAHVLKRSDEDFYCGEDARLNIHEKLIKDEESNYIYTDELGNKHYLKETFYYIASNGDRQDIVDKTIITILPNGNLIYKDPETSKCYEVQRKETSFCGMKATTKLEGFKKSEMFEVRANEQKQLEEQMDSYKSAINNLVVVNDDNTLVCEMDKNLTNAEEIKELIENDQSKHLLIVDEFNNLESVISQKNLIQMNIDSINYSIEMSRNSLINNKQSLINSKNTLLLQQATQSIDSNEIIENQISTILSRSKMNLSYLEYLFNSVKDEIPNEGDSIVSGGIYDDFQNLVYTLQTTAGDPTRNIALREYNKMLFSSYKLVDENGNLYGSIELDLNNDGWTICLKLESGDTEIITIENLKSDENYTNYYLLSLTEVDSLQSLKLALEQKSMEVEIEEINENQENVFVNLNNCMIIEKQIQDFDAQLDIIEQQIIGLTEPNENDASQKGDLISQRTMLNKQIEECNEQINNLKLRSSSNEIMFLKYYKEYLLLNEKYETLMLHMPINYITNDSGAKGFNENGDLVIIYDKHGKYAAIEYEEYFDGSNKLTRIARIFNEKEQFMQFVYDHNNLLVKIVDSTGRTTAFEYSSTSPFMLSKIIYPNEEYITLVEWTAYEKTLSTKYEKSVVASSFFNGVSSITNSSFVDTVSYEGVVLGDEQEISKITFIYDYKKTSVFDKKQNGAVYSFDDCLNIVEAINIEEGLVTSANKYSYNDKGFCVVEEYPKNSCLYVNVDDFIFAMDYDISYEYDEYDNLKSKIIRSKPISSTLSETTLVEYFYDKSNHLIKTKTVQYEVIEGALSGVEKTNESLFEYNSNGLLIKKQSYTKNEEFTNGINIEEYVYNDNGYLTTTIMYNSLDPSSKLYKECEVDENGKVTGELDQCGINKIAYKDNSVIHPNGSIHSYGVSTYDGNSAITISTENGEENSIQRLYTNGYLTRVISGDNVYDYTYDHKGRETSVSINGQLHISYSYEDRITENGKTVNKITATYVNGDNVTVTEDLDGNVLSVNKRPYDYDTLVVENRTKLLDPNASQIELNITNEYDDKHRVIKKMDSSVNDCVFSEYEYDEQDRVTSYSREATFGSSLPYEEEYSYNSHGNVAERTVRFNNGRTDTTTCEYDERTQKLKAFTCAGSTRIEPKVDCLGRNRGKTVSWNGTKIYSEDITYLKHGDHTTIMPLTISYGNNTENGFVVKDRIKYKYDEMGNICEAYENGQFVTEYKYDTLGRLVRENNKKLGKTFVFSYDNKGNIVTRTEYAFTLKDDDFVKEATGEVFEYVYSGEKLVSYNGEVFEYDDIGNPTTYRGNTLTWRFGRRLTSFGANTFDYNAEGKRIKKNDISYIYDSQGRLFAQSNGIEYFYDEISSPIAFAYNGEVYYYKKDLLGNVIEILDTTGTTVVKYTYDAWGNHTVTDYTDFGLGSVNPIRYRSYYYDTETGLYFLQTRYYDPHTGRFINIDDVSYLEPETINGLNLYAYCGDNPIEYFDPNGQWSMPNWLKWIIGAVAFAGAVALTALTGGALAPMFIQFGASIVLGGLIQGTVNAIQGENFWEGFADGAASGALTGGVLALGQSIFRVIKVANYASKGLTIGKTGTFKQVGQMTGTAHYGGLKSHGFLSKVFGRNFADKVGWIQNKSIVQGVMKFKGVIYDCGGQLTGAYAKEIALTKGYQYFVNIWLL